MSARTQPTRRALRGRRRRSAGARWVEWTLRALAASAAWERLLPLLAPSGRSLRARLLVLMLVAGLVPTVALGAVGLPLIARLAGTATAKATAALVAGTQTRLQASAEDAAGAVFAEFEPAQEQAYQLALNAQYIFSNPELYPEVLQGNTGFTALPDGDLANHDPQVGVYVPAAAAAGTSPVWNDVRLLSHIDPLLRSVVAVRPLPPIVRFWVATPSGMVRADPSPRFDLGLRMDVPRGLMGFYGARAPGQLLNWQFAVWTLPYTDTAAANSLDSAHPQIVSVLVPVYDAAGVFHGLSGADVEVAALQSFVARLPNLPKPFTSAVLYRPVAETAGTGGGASAPPTPYPTAGHPAGTVIAATPGAPDPSAFGVPSGTAGATLLSGLGANGTYVAFAPVGMGGWMLAEAAPASAVAAQSRAVARQVRRTEAGAAALLLALMVLLGAALLTLARRASATVSEPLRRLAAEMRDLGAAGDGAESGMEIGVVDRPPREEDEVSALTGEFAALTARLEAATRRWRREAEERARAELAVLRERTRLAREVHDTLAQAFLSIVLLTDGPGAEGRLGQVADVARQGLRQARQSMAELAPRGSGDAPFVHTVRQEAAAFAASLREPVEVQVRDEGWPDLPLPVQVALLGVLRSALGNVREHAGARQVRITLGRADLRAVLEIADDGRGFDPAAAAGAGSRDAERGRGLPGMRERLAEVGGDLAVESAPGRGSRIQASVPVTGP